MKKALKYFLIILIFVVVNLNLGVHVINQFREFRLKNAPISIAALKEQPTWFLGTVDLDNNGDNQAIIFQNYNPPNKSKFLIFKLEKSGLKACEDSLIQVPPHFYFYDAYYRGESATYIYCFLEPLEKKITLWNLDQRQKIHKKLKFDDLNIDPLKIVSMRKPILVDLDGDGKKEMLIPLAAYYYPYPRGVVCFDPGSGKLLWEYYSGAVVHKGIKIRDLDGDQNKEVILSSSAVNNGAEMNGTSDMKSYVIVLDSNGKELWKKIISTWYTFAQSTIADLDHDGRFEIITATECHQARLAPRGWIYILDAITGKEKASYSLSDTSFSKPYVWDGHDFEKRIYVGDAKGRLWMFDQNLNPLKIIKENNPIRVLNSSPASHRRNYLFALTPNKFLAYDMDLDRKIFQYAFEPPIISAGYLIDCSLVPINAKETNFALLITDKLYGIRETRTSFIMVLKNLVTSGLMFTVIILLLFNILFIYFISRLKSIDFSHIRRKEALETVQFLEIIQDLAHQIKNPISTILWTAEKMKRGKHKRDNKEKPKEEDFNQLADFLMDDVKTLKQQTNHLLKLTQIRTPRFCEKNLKTILLQLVNHYRLMIDEKTGIQLEIKIKEDIFLSIDEELFKGAMTTLMDNLVAALPLGGKFIITAVLIKSYLKGKTREAVIKLEITGGGIDRENLSRIFVSLFTGKSPGIDRELFICKRIIEIHHGKIEMSNRKRSSAQIKITIPVKRRTTEQ
jgi:signal transduction histidine kinase